METEPPAPELRNVASSPAPTRAELLNEYVEAGHFLRLHAQLSFNYLTVFLAATGGALTIFRNLPAEGDDVREVTALFGVVMSLVFLSSSERRTFRTRAAHARAREIEAVLGLRLHESLTGEPSGSGLRVATVGLHRALFAGGALVWIYAGVRTLLF